MTSNDLPILNGDHAQYEIDNINTPKEERVDWPYPSFDARDWAKAFCKVHPTVSEDDALGWFANALMRGYDHPRTVPIQGEVVKARDALEHAIKVHYEACMKGFPQAYIAERLSIATRTAYILLGGDITSLLSSLPQTVAMGDVLGTALAKKQPVAMGEKPEGRLSEHACDKCGAFKVYVSDVGDNDKRIKCHGCKHSCCVEGAD